MLRLEGVGTSYGRVRAISGISPPVERGEIVTLLGANGAGKSTILMTISGFLHPESGRIVFENDDITAASPASIVLRGLVHVPEGRRILAQLTVEENLDLAGHRLAAQLRHQRRDEVYSIYSGRSDSEKLRGESAARSYPTKRTVGVIHEGRFFRRGLSGAYWSERPANEGRLGARNRWWMLEADG
jgi:ABC-type branched-subunit amino acid transport system ATPase component